MGWLVELAEPIVAEALHCLSIPAAAQYSASTLHFLLVQELSLWHCQCLKNKPCNDEHNEGESEKAFPGI
jgi:hypothetical protein